MKSTQNKPGLGNRSRQTFLIALIVLIGVLLSTLLLAGTNTQEGGSEHEEHAHASEDTEKQHDSKETEHADEGGETHADEEQHGREVTFTQGQIEAAGITLATAGPASIQSTIQLPGEIVFNADRTAQLVPRLAGVVQAVKANLGQEVNKAMYWPR